MAAVAMLTADDLFRAVGKELQKHAGDNEIATQLANEFQKSGMAEAYTGWSSGWRPCNTDTDCTGCCDRHKVWCIQNCAAVLGGSSCNTPSGFPLGNPFCVAYNACVIDCDSHWQNCVAVCP